MNSTQANTCAMMLVVAAGCCCTPVPTTLSGVPLAGPLISCAHDDGDGVGCPAKSADGQDAG